MIAATVSPALAIVWAVIIVGGAAVVLVAASRTQ